MLSVADRGTNPTDAEAAFVELIRRYRGYLYTVCEIFFQVRVRR